MKHPLNRETLQRLVELVPNEPADMVRHDRNFKELGLHKDDYTTLSTVVDLLVEHPVLMQRPILVKGDRAVIGRPAETVLELLT